VGEIDFLPVLKTKEGRPVFEKPIICPCCHRVLTFEKEQVELTELGQTQITELELPFFEEHPRGDINKFLKRQSRWLWLKRKIF
jgi:hypothetical protein